MPFWSPGIAPDVKALLARTEPLEWKSTFGCRSKCPVAAPVAAAGVYLLLRSAPERLTDTCRRAVVLSKTSGAAVLASALAYAAGRLPGRQRRTLWSVRYCSRS